MEPFYDLVVSIPGEHDVCRAILQMDRQALHSGQSVSEVSKVGQHFHDGVPDLEVQRVPETNGHQWTGIITILRTEAQEQPQRKHLGPRSFPSNC